MRGSKLAFEQFFFLLYIDHFTSHTKFTLTKHSYSLISCKPNFFFKNLNFSLKMAGSSSSSAINIQSGKSLVITPNVASISKGSLRIQVENIVDFGSLARNGVELTRFFSHQQWGPFFKMLNGPTYTELVRNFWIKACIVTEKEAREEEASLVRSKQELKGKSRQKMGLSDFTETEVRSNVLGLEMVITESIIRSLLQIPSGGL